MLKTFILIMVFMFVLCEDKEKDIKGDGKAKESNGTNAIPPKPQNSINENEVSEGLKDVTDGARQILTGVLEVGSGIISAITRWFDSRQRN